MTMAGRRFALRVSLGAMSAWPDRENHSGGYPHTREGNLMKTNRRIYSLSCLNLLPGFMFSSHCTSG